LPRFAKKTVLTSMKTSNSQLSSSWKAFKATSLSEWLDLITPASLPCFRKLHFNSPSKKSSCSTLIQKFSHPSENSTEFKIPFPSRHRSKTSSLEESKRASFNLFSENLKMETEMLSSLMVIAILSSTKVFFPW